MSIFRKCIIVFLSSLGQRVSSSLRSFSSLSHNRISWFSVYLLAAVTATMSAQFVGPLTITALAELYRNTGSHCLVSYDDFSKHAVAYRQLCLYLRKPAGREAFPSDVFYLHARILERSCCLSHSLTLGSLLSLPVIETLSNDLSAYIATNVISITDGQLYLDVTLFGLGFCPAVSIDKSVSRVGAKSLDVLFRSLSFRIYTLIGDFKQEADSAVKSDAFRLRSHRYSHLMAIFVQRSASDRWSNVTYIWSLLSGQLDALPRHLLHLTLFTVANSSYSFYWLISPLIALYSTSSMLSRTVHFTLTLVSTTLSLFLLILTSTASLGYANKLFQASIGWLSATISPVTTASRHKRRGFARAAGSLRGRFALSRPLSPPLAPSIRPPTPPRPSRAAGFSLRLLKL